MNRWKLLTKREREIALAVTVGGKKSYTVGRDLGISKGRVQHYLEVVYRVLQVSGRTELALFIGRNRIKR
jgi:DNA-binding NarL/FixJ family response regulator